MKLLKDILLDVVAEIITGTLEKEVKEISFDSREVSEDTLFVALSGVVVDGHTFIGKAIEKGASVIVCEEMPEKINKNTTYIKVEDSHKALAVMASNFYNRPSAKLKLIGVTGTNGKTTVATLLYQLFKKAGYQAGLLSTVQIKVDDVRYEATHTTPNPVILNDYLNKMGEKGVTHCFMEVSSHGIHQKRIEGLIFSGGIFTNITHDHLDYHKTFKEYLNVKKSFFDSLPKEAFALVNADDKNGVVMLQNTKAKKYTYALKTVADFKAKIIENQFSGLFLEIENRSVYTKLIGSFNAYNLVAIYGVATLLGIDEIEALTVISELQNVNGRFQYFTSKKGVHIIIDYAHTPDALKNVLQTINNIRTRNEEVITVVGCGGDRDKTKRPVMGHIASLLSTQVIFTSDNPRSEDPYTILKQIEKGVEAQNIRKTITIEDREQAIKTAVKIAQPNDVILIAGKGHETYQAVKGKRHHFDDYKKVVSFLKDAEN